ncbi:MAG: 4-hydroxythreonine-4-phosphate dehydrogenase PdxA [Deltaproteobacteria bacterium]|nr:4-hydroxythreonine-4-phosphate dehydrogenase PdxA [Deltaproteobacteria bacterium]
MKTPRIAITMGDPRGIGPEIIAALMANPQRLPKGIYLVLGDDQILSGRGAQKTDRSPTKPGFYILPVTSYAPKSLSPQKAAQASFLYIQKAADLALDGGADAIVTGPVDKKAITASGQKFSGHTEYLAGRSGSKEVTMMFVGPRLKVSLVTLHIPHHRVAQELDRSKILKTARQTLEALQTYFKIRKPKLALAALNPHAGEGGLTGKEEKEILMPAVAQAQAHGINLQGPFPADTLFHRAVQGEFDAVISLYHDQALIPAKLLDFEKTVNVTLGLPFIRTSVDHGVAYDIAGRGIASSESMFAALRLAVKMAKTKGR